MYLVLDGSRTLHYAVFFLPGGLSKIVMTRVLTNPLTSDSDSTAQDLREHSGSWLKRFDRMIGLQSFSELKDEAVFQTLRATSWFIVAVGIVGIAVRFGEQGSPDLSLMITSLALLFTGILPFVCGWTRKIYISAMALSLGTSFFVFWICVQTGGIYNPLCFALLLPAFWGWLFFNLKGSLPLALLTVVLYGVLVRAAETSSTDAQSIVLGSLSAPATLGLALCGTVATGFVSGFVLWFHTRDYEEQLVKARDDALRANRDKSEFIAGIAHEVRTPLTGLMGMMELLVNEDLNPDQYEMAHTARASARNILNIINDLLDLSKIEVGELKLVPEPVDITNIFRTTAEEFKSIAHQKGLEFHVTAPTAPVWLLIDPTRFRQCASNFLSNAIKFTDRGFVHATLVCNDLENGDVEVLMSVEDTGPGIPASLHKKIFARFVQVDGTQRSEHGGTGLGLAIVNDIARLQGGQSWVESEEGVGSTFCFEAVFKRTSPLDVPDERPVARRLEEITILIADDSVGNQRMLTRVLEKLGYQTISAENGVEVLELLDRNRIDLILMDMHMPVMDGPKALGQIRALPDERKNTAVIGLSADNSEDDMQRWTNAGVDGFVLKPVDFASLDLAIRRVIGVQRQSEFANETAKLSGTA